MPNTPSITQIKADLRLSMRERLKTVPEEERKLASALLCNLLQQSPFWQKSSAILFYAPRPDELDVWPALVTALRLNKTVALLRHEADTDLYYARVVRDLEQDIAPGFYGIREPRPTCPKISLKQLDLALVPGLGFSDGGVRLGRGRGYYDRLLASFPGLKYGVGYDWQLGLPIPGEDHDVRLNGIITPSGWHPVPEGGL